jgi:hypothetical protein
VALLGGTGARNNLTACIVLMNRAVNERLGIASNARLEVTTARLEEVIAQLDEIADAVQDQLRGRLA